MTEENVIEETGGRDQPWPVRVAAELAGTFMVCFALYVLATFGSIIFSLNLAYIALGTGLAYAAVTFALGGVSGGQFNPAVTVAAMITGATKLVDGLLYIVAQVIGASLAGLLTRFLLPVSDSVTAKMWLMTAVNGFDKGSVAYSTLNQYGLSFSYQQAIAVELVASLIVVGAAMATYGKRSYAPAVGVAYAAGAAMTFPVTGAALNPARATGIALAAQGQGLEVEPSSQLWVFWICPVLAAALATLAIVLNQMIRSPKAKGDDPSALNAYDAAEDEAETSVDSEADATAETETAAASETEGETPAGQAEQVASEGVDTGVGDHQADAQADADEGVERR